MGTLSNLFILLVAYRFIQVVYQLINPSSKSPINVLNKYLKYWYFSPTFAFENYLLRKKIYFQYYSVETSNSYTCLSDKNPENAPDSEKNPLSISYRVLGEGKKVFLLSNGVGTGLFMWCLAFIYILEFFDPSLFSEKITLLLPSHRGLFNHAHETIRKNGDYEHLEVKLDLCASDIFDVLTHFSSLKESERFPKVEVLPLKVNDYDKDPVHVDFAGKPVKIVKLDGFLGWSTGAMIALRFVHFFPEIPSKLFLLNPAVGSILGFIFQPFVPFPFLAFRRFLEKVCLKVLSFLLTLIPTSVYEILRYGLLVKRDSCVHTYDGVCTDVAAPSCFLCSHLRGQMKKDPDTPVLLNEKPPLHSYILNGILFVFAFLSGSPVFQSIFFMDYLTATFRSRTHLESLLKLLLALNEPLPPSARESLRNYNKKVILVGGKSDFLTGIHHLDELRELFPKTEQKVLFSATHFLLIEYPYLLSLELLKFLQED